MRQTTVSAKVFHPGESEMRKDKQGFYSGTWAVSGFIPYFD